jgi:hypothetical protein
MADNYSLCEPQEVSEKVREVEASEHLAMLSSVLERAAATEKAARDLLAPYTHQDWSDPSEGDVQSKHRCNYFAEAADKLDSIDAAVERIAQMIRRCEL